ncbi:hypothetical protein M1563_03895 [Patescibacteria group bacterium]|nr:hypothetical protein [Patescibacteria group bacterium]
MNVNLLVESLSMDLLRAALGRHRGSIQMAMRFEKEALARNEELKEACPKDKYLNTLISQTQNSLLSSSAQKADELLMYSVLFKNLIQSQHRLN